MHFNFCAVFIELLKRKRQKKDSNVAISNFITMYQFEELLIAIHRKLLFSLHMAKEKAMLCCTLICFFLSLSLSLCVGVCVFALSKIKGISVGNSIPCFVLIEFAVTHNCDQVKWLPLWLCHKIRLKRSMAPDLSLSLFLFVRVCVPFQKKRKESQDLNCTI